MMGAFTATRQTEATICPPIELPGARNKEKASSRIQMGG